MRRIKFNRLPGVGPGEPAAIARLHDFLRELPTLFYFDYLPPLAVLNEVLATGCMDAGMSGGAKWKPFAITPLEHAALLASTSGSPRLCFVEPPPEVETRMQWIAWVMHVEFAIPYEQNVRLMQAEAELRHASEVASEVDDEDAATLAHLAWYRAADAMMKFQHPYLAARRPPSPP